MAVDTEIELTLTDGVVTAKTTKQRDMVGGKIFAFRINNVSIGKDEDGDEVTSSVLEQTEPVRHRPKLSKQAEVAMQALDDAIQKYGETWSSEDHPKAPCVPLSRWREICDIHDLSDTDDRDNKRRVFNHNKAKLLKQNLIRIFDDFVWKVHNDDD